MTPPKDDSVKLEGLIERLSALEPVMWRTRGPMGGWIASDHPPSSWRPLEALYGPDTAVALSEASQALQSALERERVLREALDEIAKGEAPPEAHGHYLAHRAAVKIARSSLQGEGRRPIPLGGQHATHPPLTRAELAEAEEALACDHPEKGDDK